MEVLSEEKSVVITLFEPRYLCKQSLKGSFSCLGNINFITAA